MSDKKTVIQEHDQYLFWEDWAFNSGEFLVYLGTISVTVCLSTHQGMGKMTWLVPFRLDRLEPQGASGEEGRGQEITACR